MESCCIYDLILCWSTVNCRPSLADLWEGHWLILLSRSKGRDRVNELGVVWRVADRWLNEWTWFAGYPQHDEDVQLVALGPKQQKWQQQQIQQQQHQKLDPPTRSAAARPHRLSSQGERNSNEQLDRLLTLVFGGQFLGSTDVEQPKGIDVVKEGIRKLRFSQQLRKAEGQRTPKVELTVSVDGVAIQEPKVKVSKQSATRTTASWWLHGRWFVIAADPAPVPVAPHLLLRWWQGRKEILQFHRQGSWLWETHVLRVRQW